jgi:lysophospholipase L1-like esterase
LALAAPLKKLCCLALLSVLAGACTTEPCDPNVPINPALSSFYDRVLALEAGTVPGPVRILHLGDSHIAGDRFSGALQSRFADRLGDAGRGQLPPGDPFPYYRRQGFNVQSSGGWTVFSSLRGDAVGPFGLSGYRAESASPADWMALRVTGAAALDGVGLDLLAQPGGGSIEVEIDGQSVGYFKTEGSVPSLMQVRLEEVHATRVVVRPAGDGPVAILGWGGATGGEGVLYEAHGIPGASLRVMDAWDATIVATQLASLAPDLILLGYGTNEGFDDALDLGLYSKLLDRRLMQLRSLAPHATIVLLGAFDGARLPTWADRSTSVDAGPRSALPCAPLAINERATYASLSADRDPVLGRWHGPPNLDKVREIQEAAARNHGSVYWDGADAMGGTCSIHAFVFSDPALAYGDHVHLTPSGADFMASRLWDFLMRPYGSLVCRRQTLS